MTAPYMESDHQFYRANILLLRCPWELRQLGNARRHQCGRQPLHCDSNQTRTGKATSKGLILIKGR